MGKKGEGFRRKLRYERQERQKTQNIKWWAPSGNVRGESIYKKVKEELLDKSHPELLKEFSKLINPIWLSKRSEEEIEQLCRKCLPDSAKRTYLCQANLPKVHRFHDYRDFILSPYFNRIVAPELSDEELREFIANIRAGLRIDANLEQKKQKAQEAKQFKGRQEGRAYKYFYQH